MDEKNEMIIIGQRIRKARLSKGMTQAELAEAAHIATSNVSDIELGKSRMWLSTFCKIAEALQVSADSLLRLDVPTVNDIYQSEYNEIISYCTPDEIESIMKITREIKNTMRKNNLIQTMRRE